MKLNIRDIVRKQKPLTSDSLVIDCGGYIGKYSNEVLRRWNPHIIIFEPVPELYEFCKERFESYTNVEVLPYALGKETKKGTIYVNKDASSFYQKWARSDTAIEVDVIKLSDFIKDKKVDLLAINCEGAEFEILQDLYDNNLLRSIDEILVQFHRVSETFDTDHPLMVSILEKTHRNVFEFVGPTAIWQIWRQIQCV